MHDGKHKGKRLKNEDLKMIALIKRCKADPHPDTLECESSNDYSKVACIKEDVHYLSYHTRLWSPLGQCI